ncbi:MAG TPA: hypothetical protein VGM56_21445 [Byssovorax sp.]|jgi:hypothetical protein
MTSQGTKRRVGARIAALGLVAAGALLLPQAACHPAEERCENLAADAQESYCVNRCEQDGDGSCSCANDMVDWSGPCKTDRSCDCISKQQADYAEYPTFFSCSGTPAAGLTLTEDLCP